MEQENYEKSDPHAIRILSFNIAASQSQAKEDADAWQQRKQETLELLSRLNADIIGLQDVAHDQFDYIKHQLQKDPYKIFSGSAFLGGKGNDALPVFWRADRFEVYDSGIYALSDTTASYEQIQELTWVLLRTISASLAKPRYLLLGNVNLKPDTAPLAMQNITKFYSEKLVEFEEKLGLDKYRQISSILLGSFGQEEEHLAQAAHRLFSSARSIAKETKGPSYTLRGFNDEYTDKNSAVDDAWIAPESIRRVLLFEHFEERRANGRHYSDHLPVLVDIEI